MIALRSPIFSAKAAKSGWPKPQARFWIAMARENSARGQPNSSAIGIWNTPNVARMAKPTRMTMQPAMRTGVTREAERGSRRGSHCWRHVAHAAGEVNRHSVTRYFTCPDAGAPVSGRNSGGGCLAFPPVSRKTVGMSLFLIVALPFLGALLPAVMARAGRRTCAIVTLAVTLTALAGLLVHVPAVLDGKVVTARVAWVSALGLDASFFLDGLGLFFTALILGMGALIIVYARYYLGREEPMGQFFAYLLLFQGSMLGIVLSDNVLLLLVFWELTSLTSFLLIGYWRHLPEARQGACMALAVTGLGGVAMIAGMLILGEIAGSYELTVILQEREAIQASSMYLPALVLILLGCFTKSAQFPFHFWLPQAMAAPTPVSAYLHSATMVKAGIFLMARMWPVLSGTEAWFYIVATIGLVTMVIAAVIAFFRDDLKALLAYSTVSHLGLITMLLGFGTPLAAVAAVFHIINHATFKAALFMTAGIVDHATQSRDIRRLGGLRRLMPWTFAIALVTGLSMAGIPLLNGFLSKEMMLEEAAHVLWWDRPWLVAGLATVGALFSAGYSFRYIWHVFLGPVRDDYPNRPHDPGAGMLFSPALLAVLVVLIGLMPAAFAGGIVRVTAAAVTGGELPEFHLRIWHGVTPALLMSALAVAGGALLLALHAPLDRARRRCRGPRPRRSTIGWSRRPRAGRAR